MSQRVLLENNREYGNRGLPPDQSWLFAAKGLGTGKDGQPKSDMRGAKGIASGGVLGSENPLRDSLDDRENQKWHSRCENHRDKTSAEVYHADLLMLCMDALGCMQGSKTWRRCCNWGGLCSNNSNDPNQRSELLDCRDERQGNH